MHRSSETIGNISGALAKAQIELTNPEKSLLATIRSPFPREPDRTFRYAPLSSGLDIVRKTLGRHEIAAIQSTSIDNEGGLLRLTTVLAHSSGEWISSEWPVCRISDIGSAQRMGAALTYARRYGLFTLVGIAGEDDLDAPDLGADPTPSAELARAVRQSNGQIATARLEPNRDRRPEASARSVLGEQLSASLRETLIGQLVAINSGDEAAAWAQRNMRAKNSLTAADAKNVEERFQERLSKITDVEAPGSFCNGPDHSQTPDSLAPGGPPHAVAGQGATSAGTRNAHAGEHALTTGKKRSRSNSLVALGKAVRLRDKDHRKFVFRQACLVCGRVPSDPHHLTFTQPRALGRRVSDEFLVPVCRVHHRELHRSGNEVTWWRRLNIDPLPVALRLWQQTRADDRTSRDARTESKAGTQGAPSDRASKKPA